MRISRVGKASPYVNYLTRCKYAVECVESTSTTWLNQVVELESMMRGEMESHAPSDKTTWQVIKEYMSYLEERGIGLKSHHRRRDEMGCLFVVEFMEVIAAPVEAQVIELELMVQDGEDQLS